MGICMDLCDGPQLIYGRMYTIYICLKVKFWTCGANHRGVAVTAVAVTVQAQDWMKQTFYFLLCTLSENVPLHQLWKIHF